MFTSAFPKEVPAAKLQAFNYVKIKKSRMKAICVAILASTNPTPTAEALLWLCRLQKLACFPLDHCAGTMIRCSEDLVNRITSALPAWAKHSSQAVSSEAHDESSQLLSRRKIKPERLTYPSARDRSHVSTPARSSKQTGKRKHPAKRKRPESSKDEASQDSSKRPRERSVNAPSSASQTAQVAEARTSQPAEGRPSQPAEAHTSQPGSSDDHNDNSAVAPVSTKSTDVDHQLVPIPVPNEVSGLQQLVLSLSKSQIAQPKPIEAPTSPRAELNYARALAYERGQTLQWMIHELQRLIHERALAFAAGLDRSSSL